MGFWGSEFIFGNIPSSYYNLYISTPNGGEESTPASSGVELVTEKLFRRPKPYLLGVEDSPVLSFTVNLYSPDEIDAPMAKLIQRWLFGHKVYKPLQVIQSDLADVWWNVILTEPQIWRVGNIIQGFSATAVCDAPWGWTFEKTFGKSYSSDPVSDSYTIYNDSDNNDYEYPKLDFTTNSSGGSFSITNQDDNNRVFSFTSLQANETLNVNNDLRMITSSSGLLRMSNFNKKWFRLVPGYNHLTIAGNISSFLVRLNFAQKIGG